MKIIIKTIPSYDRVIKYVVEDNKIIYIDILYNKNIEINKDSIINIVKNVFTSITRLYIGIIDRPIDN